MPFQPIQVELPPQDRDALLDRAAREVVRWRLEFPAVLALEMHRPLTFLGSQAAVVLTPMLAPLIGLENLQRLVALLEDRANLDRLIDRIEELAAARDASAGTGEHDAPQAA